MELRQFDDYYAAGRVRAKNCTLPTQYEMEHETKNDKTFRSHYPDEMKMRMLLCIFAEFQCFLPSQNFESGSMVKAGWGRGFFVFFFFSALLVLLSALKY